MKSKGLLGLMAGLVLLGACCRDDKEPSQQIMSEYQRVSAAQLGSANEGVCLQGRPHNVNGESFVLVDNSTDEAIKVVPTSGEWSGKSYYTLIFAERESNTSVRVYGRYYGLRKEFRADILADRHGCLYVLCLNKGK